MEKRFARKPSRQPFGVADGLAPAGRTRHARRAEQEQGQRPRCACAPESARSDILTACSPAPTSVPKPKRPPAETLNKSGALALAKRLERYWHDRGYTAARFWTEPISERFDKLGSYEVYRVVGNLVNGMPPRYLNERGRPSPPKTLPAED